MADIRDGLTNNNFIRYHSASYDENYEISWRLISEKIIYLLKHGPKTPMTFEPLYSQIYRAVSNGSAERVYLDLISLCSRHLNEVQQTFCPPEEVSLEHFMAVNQALKDYIPCTKKISLLFSYLNRNYVSYCFSSDIYLDLCSLFNYNILRRRMPALMSVAEAAVKVQGSYKPNMFHRFFNDVKIITHREYIFEYPHLFSRFSYRNLPFTREVEGENSTPEALAFQARIRGRLPPPASARQARKRPLEEHQTN